MKNASAPTKARILDTLQMVSKSGQRSTADNSRIARHTTGFGCDKDNKPHATTEEAFVGTRLELEGTTSPDAACIQCVYALQHHPAQPSEGTLLVEHPGLGGTAKLDTMNFHVSSVQGSTLLGLGSTTLVGAYRPETASQDILHLAFITSGSIWVGRE
jgi:hypothetical protein